MNGTDEAEWLAWRAEGITATDIADAANGTYGGIYKVVASKLGRLVIETTDAMRRGHRWESRLADTYHALSGLYVVGEQAWCEWADNPRIRSTVDGFAAEHPEVDLADVLGVVELKTYGKRVTPPWTRWRDQVQIQMLTTGTSRGVILAARIDDDIDELVSFHMEEVERDDDRIDFLLLVAERIAAHLDAGTLPDPDETTALDDVKAVNTTVNPDAGTVTLDALEDDIARHVALKAEITELGDELALIDARLRSALGDATKGTAGRWAVTVSNPRRELTRTAEDQLVAEHPEFAVPRLDRKAFEAAHKDLLDAAKTPTGARVLSIKERKNP